MNATKLTKKAQAELDRANALESVKGILGGDNKPVMYTIARRESSGGYGISQDISLFYFSNGTPWNLTY